MDMAFAVPAIKQIRSSLMVGERVLLICADAGEEHLFREIFKEYRIARAREIPSLRDALNVSVDLLIFKGLEELTRRRGEIQALPFYCQIISTMSIPPILGKITKDVGDSVSHPKWWGEYPRVNAPWSRDEEAQLIREVHERVSLAQLAKTHGRAIGGIRSRIAKIFGKDFVYPPSPQMDLGLKSPADIHLQYHVGGTFSRVTIDDLNKSTCGRIFIRS